MQLHCDSKTDFHSQFFWIYIFFLLQVRRKTRTEATTAYASSRQVAFALSNLSLTVLVSTCHAINFSVIFMSSSVSVMFLYTFNICTRILHSRSFSLRWLTNWICSAMSVQRLIWQRCSDKAAREAPTACASSPVGSRIAKCFTKWAAESGKCN